MSLESCCDGRITYYPFIDLLVYSKSPLIRRPKIRKTRNDGTFVKKSHCRINPKIRHILKIFTCAPRDLKHFFFFLISLWHDLEVRIEALACFLLWRLYVWREYIIFTHTNRRNLSLLLRTQTSLLPFR